MALVHLAGHSGHPDPARFAGKPFLRNVQDRTMLNFEISE